MFYSKRYEEIMKILGERNQASVHYLAKQLHVSEPTVRRDLKVLEEENLVKRTFGGAVKREMTTSEVPLSLRESENGRAKELIAAEAVRYIRNGDVIFLDASSTSSRIIRYLPAFSDLTVITNSPKNSLRLAELRIRSISTGGLLLENSIAYVGAVAEECVSRFNADLCFFSCRGLSESGMLTDSSLEESALRLAMFRHSKRKIFLCTSDKIGKEYLYNLCPLAQVDRMVSDAPLPEGLCTKEQPD